MHEHEDWRDDDDFFDLPPGGSFRGQTREEMLVEVCRAHLGDIRAHRHEMLNVQRGLLELQMTRTRSRGLLADFRPQIVKTAAFCGSLAKRWLKPEESAAEWRRIIHVVQDLDKYDDEAWYSRGFGVTLSQLLAAAGMLSLALLELEMLGDDNRPELFAPDWLRAVYCIEPNDPPF